MNEGMLGVLIPIIAVTLGLAIPIVRSIVEYKRKRALIEAMNKERIAAIEKGLAPPAWPAEMLRGVEETEDSPQSAAAQEDRRHRQLTSGLVLVGVGLAMLFGMGPLLGDDTARVGLIPAAIGAAMLIAWGIRGRSAAGSRGGAGEPPR